MSQMKACTQSWLWVAAWGVDFGPLILLSVRGYSSRRLCPLTQWLQVSEYIFPVAWTRVMLIYVILQVR